MVLFCLSGGVRRFNELQHHIPDISKKMLIRVLRRLEADGLIERKVYPVVPPKTEYRLTPTGVKLHEPVAQLCRWAATNSALLDKIAFTARLEATQGAAAWFRVRERLRSRICPFGARFVNFGTNRQLSANLQSRIPSAKRDGMFRW